jgi:glycopeptide antibiotics resistance protein
MSGSAFRAHHYDRVVQRRPRLVAAAAALYGLALLLIGLWPTHVDKNVDVIGSPPVQWMIRHLDLTPTNAYSAVELGANVALFVPLGLLAMAWSSRCRWAHAVLLGFAVSGAVEILQDVARPGRTASWADVMANTAGAGLGAALLGLGRARRPGATRSVTEPR